MIFVDTFIPEGFVEGTHPRVARSLTDRFNRLGPRGGPQRVAAVVADGADRAEVDALLRQHPGWITRSKAPGVFEVLVDADALGALVDRPTLFRWMDDATRLHGQVLEDAETLAAVQIHASNPSAAREAMKRQGGMIAGQAADGSFKGAVKAGALGALLMESGIESIEVLRTEGETR